MILLLQVHFAPVLFCCCPGTADISNAPVAL